jgi:hypothetical protein
MRQSGSRNFARVDFATEQTRKAEGCGGHPLQFKLHGCWDTSESLLSHLGPSDLLVDQSAATSGTRKSLPRIFPIFSRAPNIMRVHTQKKKSEKFYLHRQYNGTYSTPYIAYRQHMNPFSAGAAGAPVRLQKCIAL